MTGERDARWNQFSITLRSYNSKTQLQHGKDQESTADDGTWNKCVWNTRKLCVYSLSLPGETRSHISNIYRYTNCDMRAPSHQLVQCKVVRSSVVMFTYVSSSAKSYRWAFLIIKVLYYPTNTTIHIKQHHCLLGQASLPLSHSLCERCLPDDGWCWQPKHEAALNKGAIY
jgi:hypothetical protein